MMELDSCESCTKPTDNKKFNCPPRMSDGRHFTDYRSRCALNTSAAFSIVESDKKGNIKTGKGIVKTPPSNSFDLRQYLIQNGEKIMDMNRERAFQRNMCGPCTLNPSTMLPEQTQIQCDQNSCKVTLNDPTGLGQGRFYNTFHTPSEDVFDKRRQEREPSSCCTSSFDDFQYYPIDGKIDTEFGRLTSPSGAFPFHASDRVRPSSS